MKKLLVLAAALAIAASCTTRYDIIIVGGGAGGTSAGVQAARLGAHTLILEESTWLGGMLTGAGVSAVDGNYNMRSGFFGEFCDSLAGRYGGYGPLMSGWVSNILFEPHVGNEIFKNIAATQKKELDILYEVRATQFKRLSRGWKVSWTDSEGKAHKARAAILVDATEMGDVAAEVGIPWDLGMDDKAVTGERIAIDGGNDIIQDITMVATLKEYDHDVTIPRPEPYDSTLYVNCCINPLNDERVVEKPGGGYEIAATHQGLHTPETMLTYGRLPGGKKFMINWPIEGNDIYMDLVTASPQRRQELLDSARNLTLGFVYFMQTSLGMNHLGLADDEYPTPDLLPFIPYHRESRRIHGVVRFTMDEAENPYIDNQYRTGIAVGDYPVDHHHHRHPNWPGLPRLAFYPIPSYNVPMGVVIPEGEKDILVCEKSVSVTNLINGATRLQPVVVQLGQATGVIAALAALNYGGDVTAVPVREVQKVLLDGGGYIMPYRDLPKDSPDFGILQRIGATGIMRGVGKPYQWANQTWFRADEPVLSEEVFLEDYFPGESIESLGLPAPDGVLTRLEMARAIDSLLKPFDRPVGYHGELL